jgi:hypothetical protein
MQEVFHAVTSHPWSPVSNLSNWLDPIAALYPKFLYESLDEDTVLAPARQRLVAAYGAAAIVKMKTPPPENFCLDALHVCPMQEGMPGNDRAIVLCPGANGYYEDSFTSAFVQVCCQRCARCSQRARSLHRKCAWYDCLLLMLRSG